MRRPARSQDDESNYGIGDRFERFFVLAFSVGGIAFHLLALAEFAEDSGAVSPIWTVAVAVLVLPAPAVTLLAAIFADLRIVRTVLRAHTATFAVSLIALGPSLNLEQGPLATLWILDAIPIAMTAGAIAFRPRFVPLVIVALGVLLIIVRWIASGSPVTAVEEGIDMLMVGTVFAGLAQAVLRAGRSLEHATQEAVLLSGRAAGRLGRRRERIRVGALVHDEILSFLLSVGRTSHSTESTREAARTALAHLAELRRTDPAGPTTSRARLTGQEFIRAAFERVEATAPTADIEARVATGAGPIPAAIADAFINATVQAARNAVQHARNANGDPAAIRVEIDIGERVLSVQVSDDGDGFALASVPSDRMGLTTSILGQVRQLAGTTAQIATESGTMIRLEWRR